ncbi:unnamed protein product [Symbiodinium sp. CCMP2592]|nr:unnamed protein product [Symbiodinium sp. CCMP2592]
MELCCVRLLDGGIFATNPGHIFGPSHVSASCGDTCCTAAARRVNKDLQAVTLDDDSSHVPNGCVDIGCTAADIGVNKDLQSVTLDDGARSGVGFGRVLDFDGSAHEGGRWSQDDQDLVSKLLALLASPKGNVEQQLKTLLAQHRSDRKSRWQRPKAPQKYWNAAPSGEPVPAARRWAKAKAHEPSAQDEPSGWEHYVWHLRKDDWVADEGSNLQVLNALEDLGNALDVDDSGHVVVRVGSLDEATEALEMIAATPSACGTLVLPGSAEEESALPEAVADFKPVLSHCRVPGKLGPKLQTRPLPYYRLARSRPGFVSKNSSSWVLRVTADWHYTCDDWQLLQKQPWRPTVTLGVGVVLAVQSSLPTLLALLRPAFTLPKWISWDAADRWDAYLRTTRAQGSSGVVLGARQLGVHVRESDAQWQAPARTWSIRWLPQSFTHSDLGAMLSSMGFCEFQVLGKLVRRQGAAWTFRAKRDDQLEVVIGAYEDEAERAVEVQAMLESKRNLLRKGDMILVKTGKCQTCGIFLTWTLMSRRMTNRTRLAASLYNHGVAAMDSSCPPDEAAVGTKRGPPTEEQPQKQAVLRARAPWKPRGQRVANAGGGDCLYLSLAQALQEAKLFGSNGATQSSDATFDAFLQASALLGS